MKYYGHFSSCPEQCSYYDHAHFKIMILPRNYNGNNSSVLTANVYIFSDGSIGRYTSSGKYKTQVEDLEDEYADKILKLRPTWYRSLCERDNPKHSTYGFIAEEVAEIDPRLDSGQ